MCYAMKIFERLLDRRCDSNCHQMRMCENCGTVDAIFDPRKLTKEQLEKRRNCILNICTEIAIAEFFVLYMDTITKSQ